MPRFIVLILTAMLCLGGAPAQAAPAPSDLFMISGMQIDASAESAMAARDSAMAEGRSQAWTKLFRSLTSSTSWSRQPQLGDNALLRLIARADVSNERRSTTRYVADVTYQFIPAAVRAALAQAGIAYTDTHSRPVLVLPAFVGEAGLELSGPWSAAWKADGIQQGIVPFVLPMPVDEEVSALSQLDLAQADWAAVETLVRRYDAEQAIIAVASEDAKTVQMIEVSATGRRAISFAYAQSSFAADATAVAERAYETWKLRSAIDYARREKLVADVQFGFLTEWSRIRTQLRTVRAVADVDVIGLALDVAEISLSYAGRTEQLRAALAEQNLELIEAGGRFTLRLEGKAARGP